MGLGPFDLTGGPFLVLYLVVLALAWAASLPLAEALRAEGRPGRIAGEEDLAALAGGPVRLAESVLVRLLAAGKLVQQGRRQFFAVDPDGGTTAVERAILRMAHPADWNAILRAVTAEFVGIERRLVANGLMLDRPQRLRLQLATTVPLLLAMGFGAIKLVVGISRAKPVLLLVVLLIVTAVLIVLQFARTGRTTREGEVLLREERARCERIRRAPERHEMGQSVALYGTAVLAGSALSDFHAMRRKPTDSNGGGDGGSGCGGDGGCGGGGCGGCGGCGG